MKNFQEKKKLFQKDHEDEDEDEESMDHDDIHSQETGQEVVLHGDKGKQLLQSDVHHHHHGSGDRVCEHCGKRFRNGKALGGHIKMHFNQSPLPKKNKNRIKPKKKHLSLKEPHNPPYDDQPNEEVSSSNKISCYVCNKKFPSIKSLHGHMRLHRQRDWKGIRPPPSPAPALPLSEESNSYSSQNDSEEDNDGADDGGDDDDGNSSLSDHTIETDIDAANFLVNWTKIEQRRRTSRIHNQTVPNYVKNTSLANQTVPNHAEDQVGEFAGKKPIEESPVGYKSKPSSKNIIFDDRSNKKFSMEASKTTGGTKPRKDVGLLDQTDKKIPRQPQESRFSCKYAADEQLKKPIQDSPVFYKGKTSLKIKLKLDGRSTKITEGSRSSGAAILVPNKSSIGGKGKASMEGDGDDDNADQTSWKLRPKKMVMKPVSKTGTKPIKDVALLDQTHKQIPKKARDSGTKYGEKDKYDGTNEEAEAVEHGIKQFRCNICHCKFSTGQALGGHKRGHKYRAVPVEEAQGTDESRELEDGEISTDHEKFNLDLNQIPHESEDEGISG